MKTIAKKPFKGSRCIIVGDDNFWYSTCEEADLMAEIKKVKEGIKSGLYGIDNDPEYLKIFWCSGDHEIRLHK